jgi:hypothetical protein
VVVTKLTDAAECSTNSFKLREMYDGKCIMKYIEYACCFIVDTLFEWLVNFILCLLEWICSSDSDFNSGDSLEY